MTMKSWVAFYPPGLFTAGFDILVTLQRVDLIMCTTIHVERGAGHFY